MELIDKILCHPDYIMYLELNTEAEKERTYCHHNIQHALDVARVAYIIALENGYNLKKELIYTAALLHDIAKWKQYKEKVDHAAEGAALAWEILKDIGMEEQDTWMIVDAIRSHRIKGEKTSLLGEVLYKADKDCRLCVKCGRIKKCNRFDNGKQPVFEY